MSTLTPSTALDGHEVDPVTVELVRQSIISVTEEMKTKLLRAAYNLIIYEALDFTVGLFDAAGRTLSIGLGLPMFVRGMSDTVAATLEKTPVDQMRPGDIFITNDAYTTGSHLNHIVLTQPVFHGDEVVAFTCSMAHWLDIGGVRTGMTTEIYEEGLQIPCLRLYREGVVNQDLIDIIELNVRTPRTAMGDLRAQVGAVRAGARRFEEAIEHYGIGDVLTAMDQVPKLSAARAAASVRAIPDGDYHAVSYMDGDGVADQPIPIAVTVTVAGDRMTIDLSGVGEQVEGFYNSGRTAGESAAQVAFKALVDPAGRPINDGTFEHLDIVLPERRVVSAVRPAAMRWWMTVPMTVVDTILRALAAAVPEQVAAGHHADLGVVEVHGTSTVDGRRLHHFGGLVGGGWGAKSGEDGVSATICINDGDTHNTPVESAELRQPVVIERYALREDSCGPGRWRGGLGVIQECRVVQDARMDAQIERTVEPPWGLHGGEPAAANRLSVRQPAGEENDVAGKVFGVQLAAGSAFVLRTGGGGGFGDPRLRPAEHVAEDVRQGYVSVAAARDRYGVACDDAGVIDLAATKRLRDAVPTDGADGDTDGRRR